MDIYNTAVLIRVVRGLKRLPSFFLDLFFPEVDTPDSLDIYFDVDDGRPTIAPYVSPLVEGKVLKEEGFTTKHFRPAYVKPKNVVNPERGFKRALGERIGGSLSPEERIMAYLRSLLSKQIEGVDNRCELQAIEAMRTGKITVTGESYPTKIVDFGRSSGLTVDISGGAAAWGAAGVSPLKDIGTWAALVLDASGAVVTDVIMDPKAWELFAADEKVITDLDTKRVKESGSLALGAAPKIGGMDMGTLRGFNFWQYQGSYKDTDGSVKKALPDYTVIMGSRQLEGVRTFAAIRDERAGLRAMQYFPKSWLNEDPAVRYLMTQSAPLMVPYRPNASLCATVKAD